MRKSTEGTSSFFVSVDIAIPNRKYRPQMHNLSLFIFGCFFGALLVLAIPVVKPELRDDRQRILVSPDEDQEIRLVMRENLKWMVHMMEAASRNEWESFAAYVQKADANRLRPEIRKRMPEDWRMIGSALHSELYDLARLSEKDISNQVVFKRLAQVTNWCLACHNRYRLEVDTGSQFPSLW